MNVVTIGRSSKCDIIIQDNSVSRIHAKIWRSGSGYVYEDLSSNGTSLNGKLFNNEKVQVVAGAPLMLCGRIPLPWSQIYAMLPSQGIMSSESKTHIDNTRINYGQNMQQLANNDEDLGFGLSILSFLFPVVGWILWGVWRKEHPKKAHNAALIAWISFGLNFIIGILSVL